MFLLTDTLALSENHNLRNVLIWSICCYLQTYRPQNVSRALSVGRCWSQNRTLRFIWEYTQERNHSSVKFVTNDLQPKVAPKPTCWFTWTPHFIETDPIFSKEFKINGFSYDVFAWIENSLLVHLYSTYTHFSEIVSFINSDKFTYRNISVYIKIWHVDNTRNKMKQLW